MPKLFSSLFVLLLSCNLVLSQQPIYRTYHNARYNYSIAYPSNLLEPQGEAENGDGQKFMAKDGKALMLVYGTNNIDNDSATSAFRKALAGMKEDGRVITYQVLKGNWYVISGRHDKNIFYSRTIHRGATSVTFIIEYNEAERATYDTVTTRIAKSFSG